ncbi:MAG: helix-turn-helix transcriptional regulator [Haloplanus sp.]
MSDTVLDYLARSTSRREVLVAFRDHGRLTPRVLESHVSVSRRTLKRTLDNMASRGWIRAVDDGYELTALGATVLRAYECFHERTTAAARLSTFLSHLPSSFDLDPTRLADANLAVATENDPYAPVDRLMELRADASFVREAARFLYEDSVRQLTARAHDDPPARVHLVLMTDPDVSVARPVGFEKLLDAPSVDCRFVDTVDFLFGVVDDRAFVGATEDDQLRVFADTDDVAVVEWVERRFRALRDAADPP